MNTRTELSDFLAEFDNCFPRRDTRRLFAAYVEGLLSDLPRKSVEPLALRAGIPPRTLQQFLTRSRWDEDAVRSRLHEIVATLEPAGGLIGVLQLSFLAKKGRMSPGVERLKCPWTERIDNFVVSIRLGCVLDGFHFVLDSELFLPKAWSEDRARCRKAEILDSIVFRPWTEISAELLKRASDAGIRFRWLLFDARYGNFQPLVRALDDLGLTWIAEVSRKFAARTVRLGPTGESSTSWTPASDYGSGWVENLLLLDPVFDQQPWQEVGEVECPGWYFKDSLIIPSEDGFQDKPCRLLIASRDRDEGKTEYLVSNNVSPEIPAATLLRLALSRRIAEGRLLDTVEKVGLNHFEGRGYRGLKRHWILGAVASLFLSNFAPARSVDSGQDRPVSPAL
jgi:hypothetical protein